MGQDCEWCRKPITEQDAGQSNVITINKNSEDYIEMYHKPCFDEYEINESQNQVLIDMGR